MHAHTFTHSFVHTHHTTAHAARTAAASSHHPYITQQQSFIWNTMTWRNEQYHNGRKNGQHHNGRSIALFCETAKQNYRSLLQNVVSFIGLFCETAEQSNAATESVWPTCTSQSLKLPSPCRDLNSGDGKQARSAEWAYGVATSSRLLKIIGVFCRISSLL